MVGHERGDEIIAVIIAWLKAEAQRNAGIRAGAFEQLRPEFLFEEWIGVSDIDEQLGHAVAELNIQFSFDDEEEVVGVMVAVPDELAFHADDAHVVPIIIGNDLRGPPVGETAELLRKIDLAPHQ
jgi:hypothetical protein